MSDQTQCRIKLQENGTAQEDILERLAVSTINEGIKIHNSRAKESRWREPANSLLKS